MLTVKFPNRINIGDKLAAIGQRAQNLQLKILLGVRDANAIVLSEHLEEMDALMHELVPRVPVAVAETALAVRSPFLEQNRRAVFSAEVSSEGFLEAAAKQHVGSGVFLAPAFQIAKTVTARAAQILGDLGIAIDHDRNP